MEYQVLVQMVCVEMPVWPNGPVCSIEMPLKLWFLSFCHGLLPSLWFLPPHPDKSGAILAITVILSVLFPFGTVVPVFLSWFTPFALVSPTTSRQEWCYFSHNCYLICIISLWNCGSCLSVMAYSLSSGFSHHIQTRVVLY